MKKIFLIAAIIIIGFTSCKKEKTTIATQCWKCSFGTINGYTPPDSVICTNGSTPAALEDSAGNQYNTFCTLQ